MNTAFALATSFSLLACCVPSSAADPWIVYEGGEGPGKGKHLVLLGGDEEYRSEEFLPLLGKILSRHHGFKCTVLLSVNDKGEIDPENQSSLPNAAALDSADLIVMGLRFRNWPDAEAEHFRKAFERGTPIVALRTSTHAFKYKNDSPHAGLNSFGKDVLGEGWVSHWGKHKVEGTRGVIAEANKDHPILRGVSDVFGDTDVYEAYPPADATILLHGGVTATLKPDSPLASHQKKSKKTGTVQPVNDPMMPVAWTREQTHEDGTTNRIFTTTMGSATDFANEGLRRLVVNACYWGLDMETPEKAEVSIVGPYEPTAYGFKTFKKGVKPADLAIK